jgi:hypothetical protein
MDTLIKQTLGWEPDLPLRKVMEKTYTWMHDVIPRHN